MNAETPISQTALVVPSAAVRPVLECVAVAPGGYIARFRYRNDNTVAVTIPVGSRNRFTGYAQLLNANNPLGDTLMVHTAMILP